MKIPPVISILEYEKDLWQQGFQHIAGIDEAGRGPLAGPVVSGCVIFRPYVALEGVYDSKALTPQKRSELYEIILNNCAGYGLGIVDNETIDQINILEATKLSMLKAVQSLKINPDFILIDAVSIKSNIPYKSIIKGDQKSFTIAAASIIAKVYRDRLMDNLHEEYPHYLWNKNKGYGTEEHRKAIHEHGLSPYHRKSFTVK